MYNDAMQAVNQTAPVLIVIGCIIGFLAAVLPVAFWAGVKFKDIHDRIESMSIDQERMEKAFMMHGEQSLESQKSMFEKIDAFADGLASFARRSES